MRGYLASLLSLVVVALSLVAVAPPVLSADNEAVGAEIEGIVRNGESNIGTEKDDERLIQVFTFYFDRSFKPVWVRDSGPKSKGRDLLAFLQRIDRHGLSPSSYRVREIEDLIGETHPRGLAELDMLLTRAFIDIGRDLARGRIQPGDASSENAISPPDELGAATLLDGAEQADDIADYLNTLIPSDPGYERLAGKLDQYRALARAGGWKPIPSGPALKPGATDARLPQLRDFLTATGDLGPDDRPTGPVYDEATVKAVKWFQYRHGLTQDGVIGPTTLEHMNVPIEDRIRQLEINMERRRWQQRDPGNFYIYVNLADQYLKVVRNGKTTHTALLVVGKPFTRTPVFTEKMTYLVFNPTWGVPASIANGEYLPKLRSDPGYLQRQNIRILNSGGKEVDPYSVDWSSVRRMPYQLRQDSGPGNALGRIKFMFPNKFSVYIHDTPAKSLFSKDLRVFSHGCMRVQYPEQLAEVLLRGQGWNKDKIAASIATGKERIVKLEKPVPVYVTYLTAWVNKDGSAHFRRDVYKRDEALGELLLAGTDFYEH